MSLLRITQVNLDTTGLGSCLISSYYTLCLSLCPVLRLEPGLRIPGAEETSNRLVKGHQEKTSPII